MIVPCDAPGCQKTLDTKSAEAGTWHHELMSEEFVSMWNRGRKDAPPRKHRDHCWVCPECWRRCVEKTRELMKTWDAKRKAGSARIRRLVDEEFLLRGKPEDWNELEEWAKMVLKDKGIDNYVFVDDGGKEIADEP